MTEHHGIPSKPKSYHVSSLLPSTTSNQRASKTSLGAQNIECQNDMFGIKKGCLDLKSRESKSRAQCNQAQLHHAQKLALCDSIPCYRYVKKCDLPQIRASLSFFILALKRLRQVIMKKLMFQFYNRMV